MSEAVARVEDLGPAMAALAPKDREFVEAFVDLRSYKVAGAAFGMSGVDAWELAHTPKVQAAILEVARKTMRAGTASATKLLLETVEDTGASLKDRLKAALAVLDRGGIPAVSERRLEVDASPLADAALVGFAGALLERMARRPELDAARERVIEAEVLTVNAAEPARFEI